MKPRNAEGAIDIADIERWRRDLAGNSVARIARNAVTQNRLVDVALNRDVMNEVDMVFSHEVEPGGDVTRQHHSGTCWAFAELNWLRTFVVKKLKIKKFEFSENFVVFYDKLEKANHFLEKIIEWRGAPFGDRLLTDALDQPQQDGGNWHLMANIITKYGLVPESVMPDTYNRTDSRWQNDRLDYILRWAACRIRSASAEGETVAGLRRLKKTLMNEIYRVLVILFGEPPALFNWSWREKTGKKEFHRLENVTPKEWYKKCCGVRIPDVVGVCANPQTGMKFDEVYVAEDWQDVPGGPPMKYMNQPIDEIRKIAVRSLKRKEPVVFTCWVDPQAHDWLGILHENLLEYDILFGNEFAMPRPDRLDYRADRTNHVMLITGMDIARGKPVKWKVENSWGKEMCNDGFFLMSDGWFSEYVGSIHTLKKHLTKRQRELLKKKPIVKPHWRSWG